MPKQSAGKPVSPIPPGPRNAQGNPSHNPSASPQRGPMADGHPVTPAVARVRKGPAAAQGHGGGK